MSSAPVGRRSWLRPALLFVLVIEGALVLWSIHRFHSELRRYSEETAALDLVLRRLAAGLGSGTAPAAAVPQGDGLVIGGVQEPGSLNRYASQDPATRTICNYVHDGLLTLDPRTLEPAPGLATSWEVEPGGAAIVFRLRKDVFFSDGSWFSARDVLFTRAALADPGVPGVGVSSVVAGIERIETSGPLELRFVLKKPSFSALTEIGTGLKVLCAAWWTQKIAEAAKQEGTPLAPDPGDKGFARLFCGITDPGPGTGPYRFDPERSWKRAAHLTLFRNETSWWKRDFPERWNLASIRWRFLPDSVAQWEELAAGKIDLLAAEGDRWQAAKAGDPKLAERYVFARYDHPGLGHVAILWNCRRAPFDDPRVRRALTMLVDREAIVRDLFKGQGTIATCVFKPGTPEYSPEIEPLPFARERARRELAEAGWTDHDGNGSLDRDGKEFKFALEILAGSDDSRRIADQVVLWMKDAGIEMTVHSVDWGTFHEQVFRTHVFAAAVVTFGHSDVMVDPFADYHSSEDRRDGENYCGLRDPQIDDLLERAHAELDRAKRVILYREFNVRLDALQPHTLIRHPLVSAVLSARFRNAAVNRKGLIPEEWYVPTNLQLRNR